MKRRAGWENHPARLLLGVKTVYQATTWAVKRAVGRQVPSSLVYRGHFLAICCCRSLTIQSPLAFRLGRQLRGRQLERLAAPTNRLKFLPNP